MASASSVLKRVAFLNRSGSLSKPLRYSEVRGALEGLGEVSALKILQDLEENASIVPDPVEYIREQVGSADEPMASQKRKVSDMMGGVEDSTVMKRLRRLNNSGQLTESVDAESVRDALTSVGIGQAMTILKGLEDGGDEVLNPTKYIRLAVQNAGGIDMLMDDDDEDEADGPGEPDDDGADEDDQGQEEEDVPEDEDLDDEDKGEDPISPPSHHKAVKTELGIKSQGKGCKKGKGKGGKSGKGKGKDNHAFWGVNSEDLSEQDRIERRVVWLNHNAPLVKEIDFDEVAESLASIGPQQAMRVLRRLEESAEIVPEPNEFIHDLVGRSGWIWAKTDVIDEDSRVAKRVTWLNKFGGLKQPIRYTEVADLLDALKVQHAMVLLREVETSSHTIGDPTKWIKRQTEKAGIDEVMPPQDVDENSAVGQRIAWLNDSGKLAASLEYGQIADGLAQLGEEEAISLISDLEQKGRGVKDPTGFIKFKMKAKLASMGFTLEQGQDDETKILKRVDWLNDYGGLMADIDYNQVSQALQTMGIEHAMTILKELEDNRRSILDPTAFIKDAIASSRKRTAVRNAGPVSKTTGPSSQVGADEDVATLSTFLGMLNKNSQSAKQIRFSDVAGALDSLGPARALQVLQEMQEKGLGLADPVQYIKSKAAMCRPSSKDDAAVEGDDVQKIQKRLSWLNQFGALSKKIRSDEVMGALYCLGVPQSMAILKGLQEKGNAVSDPTGYIKAAVQRANGVPDVGTDSYDDPEDENAGEVEGEEFTEMDEYGGGEEAFYAAALAEAAEEDEFGQSAPLTPPGAAELAAEMAQRKRVPGAVHGLKKLTSAPTTSRPITRPKIEFHATDPADQVHHGYKTGLGVTPQEKVIQCRDYASQNGLNLDDGALQALAKLPFYKVKDLIEETLLGGKRRDGVSNASRYITISCQRMSHGLGVEQGIAMELAVSLGVVLNNEALDELASVPRREAHGVIREVAKNEDARTEPLDFIRGEVRKCRAQLDARPFPFKR